MTTQKRAVDRKQSSTTQSPLNAINPAVAALAVVVLLALVGFEIFRGSAPHSGSKTALTSPRQDSSNAWLIGKANEAKGVFANLSPADQQKVQQLTHGYGQTAIHALYRKR